MFCDTIFDFMKNYLFVCFKPVCMAISIAVPVSLLCKIEINYSLFTFLDAIDLSPVVSYSCIFPV